MIISRLSGGMGNQMFQYAIGRSLSLQYDVPLKVDTTFLLHRISFSSRLRPNFVFRNYDLDVYHIAATIAQKEDMKWWQRPIGSGKFMLFIDAVLRKIPLLPGWEKSFRFDPNVFTLGPDAYLAGFWQSPKYFDAIRDVLLRDFTLNYQLPAAIQTLAQEIQQCNTVALHVRRSDIAAKQLHGAMSKAYYDEGLAHIAAKTPIEKLYIFSDDIVWCKEHLQFPYQTVYVDEQYAGKKGEGHMLLMSTCKHFIIPNSTFSWWAAWLATNEEKIVIAPKKWFTTGTINTDDLIPATWVRI